jgi:hypothetical protein
MILLAMLVMLVVTTQGEKTKCVDKKFVLDTMEIFCPEDCFDRNAASSDIEPNSTPADIAAIMQAYCDCQEDTARLRGMRHPRPANSG